MVPYTCAPGVGRFIPHLGGGRSIQLSYAGIKNISVILAQLGPSVNGKTTDYPQKMTDCPKPMDRESEKRYTDTRNRGEGSLTEVEFKLEPGRQEPKIVILAGEESGELRRLAERLSRLALGPIPVSRGEEKLLLPQKDFLRFYADGKGVSAQTAEETYAVRLRLYELEEQLDQVRFVRISNGEIVNLDRITAVDLSLSGTIRVTLDDQVHTYVSRRYMKKIKETLNLGRRNTHERV